MQLQTDSYLNTCTYISYIFTNHPQFYISEHLNKLHKLLPREKTFDKQPDIIN